MASYLETLIDKGYFILFTGPPGCGKTARVREASHAVGRKLLYGIGGRTCDLMDRVDAAGAIWPDVAAGVARTLPLEDLRDVFACDEPAVWFLDEIGRAHLEVQGPLCSQIDRVIREKPNITVCAATNRPQDMAGVHALSSQLQSRFDAAFEIATYSTRDQHATDVVQLQPWIDEPSKPSEVRQWCDYASKNKFAPEIIAFHRATSGRTLYNWQVSKNPAQRFSDYRTWETINAAWHDGLRDLHTIGAIGGMATAAEFTAYAAMRSTIADPDDIIANPSKAPVPSENEPAALFLVCSMLADAATVKVLPAVLTYLERLPRIFGAYLGRDLFHRHQEAFVKEPRWLQWLVKNQALFNQG